MSLPGQFVFDCSRVVCLSEACHNQRTDSTAGGRRNPRPGSLSLPLWAKLGQAKLQNLFALGYLAGPGRLALASFVYNYTASRSRSFYLSLSLFDPC
jgi:hypothetical protein